MSPAGTQHAGLIGVADAQVGDGEREDGAALLGPVETWPAGELDDLKSSLPKAEHAVDRLPDPTPDDCTGLAKAAKQARTLVDAGSDDYDKLTSAQQTLTKSISACTANMTVDQIDRLFPQDGPSVTIPDTGKEAQ